MNLYWAWFIIDSVSAVPLLLILYVLLFHKLQDCALFFPNLPLKIGKCLYTTHGTVLEEMMKKTSLIGNKILAQAAKMCSVFVLCDV